MNRYDKLLKLAGLSLKKHRWIGNEETIKTANFNSRALNVLFCEVTNKEFKKISSTEVTKKARIILETTYECTKAVKTVEL